MKTIDIDFDVYKALMMLRDSEDVSYNDVLRKLLSLSPSTQSPVSTDNGAWVTKGVCFPNGTEFRAIYKGQTYYGKVESGALLVNGERFDSPSPAAIKITKNSVNGWKFWECRLPGKSSWQMIKTLQKLNRNL